MKKVEETIKEMKEELADLQENLKADINELDDEGKTKAKELVKKTSDVINASIKKIEAAVKDIKDDDNLEAFLDKVKAKTLEAVETAKEKIQSLVNGDDDDTLKKLHNDVMAEFDKLKDNEFVKKTTDFIKGLGVEINEFFEKPQVKETINKAKVTTVKYAEKGVEGLKKVLSTDTKKTKKKASTKKTTTAKKPTTKKSTAKKTK